MTNVFSYIYAYPTIDQLADNLSKKNNMWPTVESGQCLLTIVSVRAFDSAKMHAYSLYLLSFVFVKRLSKNTKSAPFIFVWKCLKKWAGRAQMSSEAELFLLQRDTSNGAWNSNTTLKYCGESPTFAKFSSSLFYTQASSAVIPGLFAGKALFLQAAIMLWQAKGSCQIFYFDVIQIQTEKLFVQTNHYHFLAALCQW